jgi:hypothetical protein
MTCKLPDFPQIHYDHTRAPQHLVRTQDGSIS